MAINLIESTPGLVGTEEAAPRPALAYLSAELKVPATWADVLAALGSIRAEHEQERARRELAEALLRKARAKVAELETAKEGIQLWGQGWLDAYESAAERAALFEAKFHTAQDELRRTREAGGAMARTFGRAVELPELWPAVRELR